MDFHLIHKNKLRVVLAAEDMRAMGLCYERMELADPATRKALRLLLESAERRVSFRPLGARLFIEAYSAEGDGCVLYFTLLPADEGRRGSGMAPVLFQFDDMETLIRAAAEVQRRYGHRIYESSLYKIGGGYRLLVQPLDYADRLSQYFLSEYGRRAGEGALAAAYTEEYGEELISGGAIEALAALLP